MADGTKGARAEAGGGAPLTESMAARLVEAARRAREHAYVPYSHFPVGAAVLAADGTIFAASNVENASFGLTICAERAAIFKAVSEGRRDLVAIAVVADTSGPPRPCGACRQVMDEFNPAMTVIMANLRGQVETLPLAEMLARPFRLEGQV